MDATGTQGKVYRMEININGKELELYKRRIIKFCQMEILSLFTQKNWCIMDLETVSATFLRHF